MFEPTPIPKPQLSDSWRYEKIARGNVVKGWLLGKVFGVTVHWLRATKPCHAVLTKGKLTCPYCSACLPQRWVGYLPLQLLDPSRRAVIIVSKRTATRADAMGSFQPVRITAPLQEKRELFIEACLSEEVGSINSENIKHGKYPALHPFLLRLWGEKVLRDYFAQLDREKEFAGRVEPATSPQGENYADYFRERVSPIVEPVQDQPAEKLFDRFNNRKKHKANPALNGSAKG